MLLALARAWLRCICTRRDRSTSALWKGEAQRALLDYLRSSNSFAFVSGGLS